MRKPITILYGTDDKPPLQVSLILALQQMSFLGVYLVISALFARELALDPNQSLQLVSATLLASGLGVLLQAAKVFGIGSGYFCPMQATSSTFAGLLLVKTHGGLSAVFGMVGVVGLAQMAFGWILHNPSPVLPVLIADEIAVINYRVFKKYSFGNCIKRALQDAEQHLTVWQQAALCLPLEQSQRLRFVR